MVTLKEARTRPGPGFLTGRGDFYSVRPLTIDDADLLHHFYLHGLGDESRRRRFLTPTPRMSATAVNYLADRDGYRKVALAASEPANGRIVGVAEYTWNPNLPTSEPEVAYAVADDYQGEGVGGNLLRMLATLSIAGGHNVWTADVLASNGAARHILTKVGNVHVVTVSAGIESLHVDLYR